MNLYSLFKDFAFQLDPEWIHENGIRTLKWFPKLANIFHAEENYLKNMEVELNELRWKYPIGLAAGLDKNAEAINFFSKLPFGALEVGTVTPRPQAGNEKPRLWRYPEEESLRNCMGFNNIGSIELKKNLEKYSGQTPIGVNLGKNKITSRESAIDDYALLFQEFHDIADYLVVNLSSPNTPGLRDLQSSEFIQEIATVYHEIKSDEKAPLYIKIAPDLVEEDIVNITEACLKAEVDGILATNTTHIPARGAGGMSGKILKTKAALVRKKVCECVGKQANFHVIGVGGIDSFDDIYDFWLSGGKVVQIYTSFIYHGPGLLEEIYHEIQKWLVHNHFQSLSEGLVNIHRAAKI